MEEDSQGSRERSVVPKAQALRFAEGSRLRETANSRHLLQKMLSYVYGSVFVYAVKIPRRTDALSVVCARFLGKLEMTRHTSSK